MTARQLQRRDTTSDWAAENPVLGSGEIGYVTGGTDAGRFKIGDGTTTWSLLPFASPITPNPSGGAENFAPIADPTLTGTTTVETLSVTSLATFAVDDPANVAVTITADPAQTADLLLIESSSNAELFSVDASGNVAIPSSTLTVGDTGAEHVVIDGSDGTILAQKAANDYVQIDPDNIGTTGAVLRIVSGGTGVFSVLGNGRVLKTGTQAGANDLLNRTELDARYLQSSWIPQATVGVGQVKAFHASNVAMNWNPGVGTWLFVWWGWTSSSDNEYPVDSAVEVGSTFTRGNYPIHQAFAMRIS
jgi:hypothetical protein